MTLRLPLSSKTNTKIKDPYSESGRVPRQSRLSQVEMKVVLCVEVSITVCFGIVSFAERGVRTLGGLENSIWLF